MEDDNHSKAMKIQVQSDDTVHHFETDVIELTDQFAPNTEEGISCGSNYVEKDMELPVRIALESGELITHKDEVCTISMCRFFMHGYICVEVYGIIRYFN